MKNSKIKIPFTLQRIYDELSDKQEKEKEDN